MSSEINQIKGEYSKKKKKNLWVKPVITPIETKKIRQEEVELYYRMMEDPEIFQRIADSGGSGA